MSGLEGRWVRIGLMDPVAISTSPQPLEWGEESAAVLGAAAPLRCD